MKQSVKISSWKDLQEGDKWLGLVCDNWGGDGSLECEWNSLWFGGNVWIMREVIDQLIAAGNDTVQREVKVEAVKLDCLAQGVYDCGHCYGAQIGPLFLPEGFKDKRVKVTVEPFE